MECTKGGKIRQVHCVFFFLDEEQDPVKIWLLHRYAHHSRGSKVPSSEQVRLFKLICHCIEDTRVASFVPNCLNFCIYDPFLFFWTRHQILTNVSQLLSNNIWHIVKFTYIFHYKPSFACSILNSIHADGTLFVTF